MKEWQLDGQRVFISDFIPVIQTNKQAAVAHVPRGYTINEQFAG